MTTEIPNRPTGRPTKRPISQEGSAIPLEGRPVEDLPGFWLLARLGKRVLRPSGAEVTRLLRANGRFCVHELGLVPDDLADEVKTSLRQGLARSIKVNARPLTIAEWKKLFEDHHMVVENVQTAPMALLQPRRLIADEGLMGALRFAKNLLTYPDARRRVLAMRRTFRANRQHLVAVAMTVRPGRDF